VGLYKTKNAYGTYNMPAPLCADNDHTMPNMIQVQTQHYWTQHIQVVRTYLHIHMIDTFFQLTVTAVIGQQVQVELQVTTRGSSFLPMLLFLVPGPAGLTFHHLPSCV
jgi:hypothetical protein